jgi:glycerol-3-phosphate acyltransferase PlsY
MMLELGVKFLLSYFLGSVMGAMVMGRMRGGVDIRTMGSGNAGGTNALRTQGAGFALGVVIIDVGKGIVGAGLVPLLDLPFVGIDPGISRTWLALCCGAAAVFGHVWPFYHNFRGGKGAATYVGTFIALSPAIIPPMLLVWAFVVVVSGYVGLATMTAAVSIPLWIAITRLPADQGLFIYSAVMAMFIIFWHRSNIERMREGVENRNERLMLFRRKERATDNEQH